METQRQTAQGHADVATAGDKERAGAAQPVLLYAVYVVVALVLCVLPSVGLVFGGAEEASDTDAAPAPSLWTEDGAPNTDIMSDFGDWFDDHFAWRNEYVTASALVSSALFGVSTNKDVVVGSDGWLYYGSTLGDYQATNRLSERDLFNVAHNLKAMQEHAEGQGARFVFAVAPNKNSLYDTHMPYYYKGQRVGDRNYELLKGYLDSQGVNTVDLHELLRAQEGVLYHARDSHWTCAGAAVAADALLAKLDVAHPDYSHRAYELRADYTGDLDKMLFPAFPTKENEVYYIPEPAYEYAASVESNFDAKIATTSDVQEGKLLMYRDSFGNALLPFMAECFGKASFSRATPYNLAADMVVTTATDAQTKKAVVDTTPVDYVVVERAERFIGLMAQEPPSVPARELVDGEDDTRSLGEFDEVSGAKVEEQSDAYAMVSGDVPSGLAASPAELVVRVDGERMFEALGYSDEEGGARWQALLPAELAQKAAVFEIGSLQAQTIRL